MQQQQDAQCKICSASTPARSYEVREMMFGSRERFRYVQCDACGCLQLATPPADLSPYYPADYYSFHPPREHGLLGNAARKARIRHAAGQRSLVGAALHALRPYMFPELRHWLQRTDARPDSRILDVGSGSAALLHDLACLGFRDLLGIDPFLDGDRTHADGVRTLRRRIEALDGEFDVIMFHHSLEHIADQHSTLAAVARLLAPAGTCLIRVPVASSFAWEHYREDWAQLDAPRHFFLHTPRSLGLLAERAGLRIESIRYDSTEFQFAASELYRQDVPLREWDGRIDWRRRRQYRARAAELNREGRGDQAEFYLRHAV